jgi:hypothetical protein
MIAAVCISRSRLTFVALLGPHLLDPGVHCPLLRHIMSTAALQ